MEIASGIKIAVIGGSGFVGSAIVDDLSRDFEVRVVDVRPPRNATVEFAECDVRDKNVLATALRGVDIVIDTAIVQIPRINQEKQLGYEVNVCGVQNACDIVRQSESIKAFILASSWHVFGEREFHGIIDEGFGFRPDKIEPRAKLYALCKIAQEAVVRIADEMSNKVFGIVRLGTVLGENMPPETAANLFIERALQGQTLTPFRHTMYRPMLYVDIQDVCNAFKSYSKKIVEGSLSKDRETAGVVNVFWTRPITIMDLALTVKSVARRLSQGKLNPVVEVLDQGFAPIYRTNDKLTLKVNIAKAKGYLDLGRPINPRETIARIMAVRLATKAPALDRSIK